MAETYQALKTPEMQALEYMLSTDGWKIYSKMLDSQEALAMRKLRTCSSDKLERSRGYLDGIEFVKRWTGVKLLTAAQALNDIQAEQVYSAAQ